MPSYLVTGGSRGIGFELLKQLSENADNVVVTLVRNKPATETKIAAEIPGRNDISVVQGDLRDVDSLKAAFVETKKIIGDSLDVLIANAALMSDHSAFASLSELSQDPKALEDDFTEMFKVNVVGNVHLFNIFLPLVKNGATKKVVTISTGMSDGDVAVKYELYEGAPYSVSKAAMNMVNAKYQAEFKKDGIIFMAVCPGTVNTGQNDKLSPENMQKLMAMGGKFAQYVPHFQGPAEPEDAVRDVLNVIRNASMEVNGGQIVSHFGNKQWL